MTAVGGMTMQATDEQLVARFRAGDIEAFGSVYATYERHVFRYAYHLLGSREDADDIKQETFLKAYAALPKLRSDASLHAWLLKICGNLCRDRMRSWERRNVVYDASREADSMCDDRMDANPHNLVERADTTALILKALRGMPPPQREMIILHEIEGLDQETIANILNVSRASVKLRLFRARRNLRERAEALLGEK